MRSKLITVVALLMLTSCQKDVEIEEILTRFDINKREIEADGQSTVELSVRLSEKSSSDRRKVIFSTSSGLFPGSGDSKHTSTAAFEDGRLVAKASLRVGTQPGTIKISVQPEYDSPIGEYMLLDSIVANPSVPYSIKLEPSAFGIGANFINEISLTGNLKNQSDKFVSKGYKVQFEDFLADGSPANGRFRSLSDVTVDSSKVAAFYAAGNHPIGTQLIIRITVLDPNGEPLEISDSTSISINQ